MSTTNAQCNICASDSLPLAQHLVLGKHDVQYYSCVHCGFIQTQAPYWLDEAYSSAIARSDLGLIGRNIKYSNFCSALVPLFFDPKGTFLDYGGGNGMFVRMMRDKGFDFYWLDKFAANQFAEGFEADPDNEFSLLTAFEVFEHLTHPLETIAELFRYAGTVVFSTRVLPRWKIMPDEWWYFAPDTGQHVSLYSMESLKLIARKFNVHLSSNGISLHILSSRSVPGIVMKALSFYPFAGVLSGLLNIRRKSLLDEDYYRLTGRRLT
jgi:hypothetical protein